MSKSICEIAVLLVVVAVVESLLLMSNISSTSIDLINFDSLISKFLITRLIALRHDFQTESCLDGVPLAK